MLRSRRISGALRLAPLFLAALTLAPASAGAAPVTVHVRVEGASSTLFDGNVTTDARQITASDSSTHPCDVSHNGSNGGFPPPAGAATTALYDAAAQAGLAFNATWFASLNDFFVNAIGAEASPNWGYSVNYTTASVGGCQFQLAPGSDVLWASNFFAASHLLKLAGPASANLNASVTFQVSDGQTGQPVSGASVAGSVSDSAGNATITFTHTGAQTIRATKPDSVRSASLAVCVHSGNDGTCGSPPPAGSTVPTPPASLPTGPPPTPPSAIAAIAGPRDGHQYSRRKAPRVLRGEVLLSGGETLRQVLIRLERRRGRHCSYFSGRRERFVAHSCGATSPFFAVGRTTSFSYLLPSPLPPGHYVLDVEAQDHAGRLTGLAPGKSRVVFDVR